MSTLEPDAQHDDTPKAVPCDACGEPASGRIWCETNVCPECYADWHKRAPDAGAIEARYGDGFAPLCAAMERFTTAWLAKRQAELKSEAA